jgi:hypothetical protein
MPVPPRTLYNSRIVGRVCVNFLGVAYGSVCGHFTSQNSTSELCACAKEYSALCPYCCMGRHVTNGDTREELHSRDCGQIYVLVRRFLAGTDKNRERRE